MNKEELIQQAMEEFKEKVDKVFVGKTPKLPGKADELYECDVFLFRHKGMGYSKQIIIANNKVSIMTITMSYLETLIRKGIANIKELEENLDYLKTLLGEENENSKRDV